MSVPLSAVVASVGAAVRPPDPRPDAALVSAFTRTRCPDAATELVRRHGPMVYGVCRRVFAPEADDAFQAVWLVFSRNARRIAPPGAVGAWLHGVAVKVSTKARTQSLTRRRRLMTHPAPAPVPPPSGDPLLAAVLDEELARLPDQYRAPVLLCDLGGKTRVEAARELGWPEGTVASRLAKGRELLAGRLRRRGVAAPVVLAGLAVPVPAVVARSATALLLGGAAPPTLLPLADAAGAKMIPTSVKLAALGLLAAVGLTVGGIGVAPAPAKPDDTPASGWVLKAELTEHKHLVTTAEFSPDGKTFATAAHDGGVIVWDAATLKPVSRVQVEAPAPHTGMRGSVSRPTTAHRRRFGPPPTLHFAGGSLEVDHWTNGMDWTKRTRFDPATGKRLDSAPVPDSRELRAVGPDGRRLLIGKGGRRVAPATTDEPAVALAPSDTTGWSVGEWGWWSPDGKRLVLKEQIYNPPGGNLRVYDPADGKLLHKLTTPAGSWPWGDAVFDPAARTLAAHYAAPTEADHPGLVVWDAETGAERFRAPPAAGDGLGTLAFTPDGTQLLSASVSGVRVWDMATGKPLAPLPVASPAGVSDIALSPDGKTLVVAVGNDHNGRQYRPADELDKLKGEGRVRVYVRAEVAEPAGEWEVAAVHKDHGKLVTATAFAPDGKTFATAAEDQVIVWDAATLKKLRAFPIPWPGPAYTPSESVPLPPPHTWPVRDVSELHVRTEVPWRTLQYLPDGMLAVVGTQRPFDHSYCLLDPATGKALDPVARGTRALGPVVINDQRERLGFLCIPLDPLGKEFKLLSYRPGGDAPLKDRTRFQPDRPYHVTLRPDGKRAAVTEWVREGNGKPGIGHIAVCDVATGKTLDELKGIADGPLAVDWSPDGRQLLAGGRGEFALWGTWGDKNAALAIQKDADVTTVSLKFAPDGRSFVAGRRSGGTASAVLYQFGRNPDGTGWPPYQEGQKLPVHPTEAVGGWAFSPDGTTLVAAVGDWSDPIGQPAGEPTARAKNGEVRVFRKRPKPPPAPAGEWKLKSVAKDHGQMVYDAAFSPDGKRLATAGADGTVLVWDAATGTAERRIEVVKNLPPPGPATLPKFDPLAGPRTVKPKFIGQEPREPGEPPPAVRVKFADGQLRVSYTTTGDGRPENAGYDPVTGQRLGLGPVDADLAGQVVFAARGGAPAMILNTPAGEVVLRKPDSVSNLSDGLFGVTVSPNGTRAAVPRWSPQRGMYLHVYDAATGQVLFERDVFSPNDGASGLVAFSPDGRRLAIASAFGRVKVLAADGSEVWANADTLIRSAEALTFTPDGKQLLVAGWREEHQRNWLGLLRANIRHREVWVRDAATGERLQSLELRTPTAVTADNARTVAGNGLPVGRLAVSADGRTLAVTLGSPQVGWPQMSAGEQTAAAAAGEVRLYTRGDGPPPDPTRVSLGTPVSLKDHGQMVYDAAFSPDGKQFASVGADGTLIVWDAATLKPTARWEVTKNILPAGGMAPNPQDIRLWWLADGIRVRFGGDRLATFDPAGKKLAERTLPDDATPLGDGERFVVRSRDRTALHRPGRPDVVLPVPASTTAVPQAAFSADGTLVALVELQPDVSNRLRVCDAVTGKTLAERPLSAVTEGYPVGLAFSRDGKRLFAGLTDGGLVSWTAPDWAEAFRRPAGDHGGPTTALAVSADSSQVLEAGTFNQQERALGLIPTGTSRFFELRAWAAATGRWRSSTLSHLNLGPTGGTVDFDKHPVIYRLAVSPDGRTVLAPHGSAHHGSRNATAATQKAKAAAAELQVYRRPGG